MRGRDDQSDGLFSYVRLEKRIPEDHPLRPIRMLVDEVLKQMSARFDALYAGTGRSSIAPEMLLRATLLQAFFSVRSERQLMEQIDYNLLFRWFVGLPMDAQVWHATVFSHNRDRLLEADVAREALIEAVATFDDALVEKYLDGQELTIEEELAALKKGVMQRGIYPVVMTSATHNTGVRRLLDTLVVCLPSPLEAPPETATDRDTSDEVTLSPDSAKPLCALVFKTLRNWKRRGKLGDGFGRVHHANLLEIAPQVFSLIPSPSGRGLG